MRKHIYLSIKQRLKSILGTDEEPIIKHFDLWNQQTDFLEQETPFNTPAVFIEFGEANWHQLGNRISDADLTVRLHIITRDFMQTADYSPLEMDALSYLDLIDIRPVPNFNFPLTSGQDSESALTIFPKN